MDPVTVRIPFACFLFVCLFSGIEKKKYAKNERAEISQFPLFSSKKVKIRPKVSGMVCGSCLFFVSRFHPLGSVIGPVTDISWFFFWKKAPVVQDWLNYFKPVSVSRDALLKFTDWNRDVCKKWAVLNMTIFLLICKKNDCSFYGP